MVKANRCPFSFIPPESLRTNHSESPQLPSGTRRVLHVRLSDSATQRFSGNSEKSGGTGSCGSLRVSVLTSRLLGIAYGVGKSESYWGLGTKPPHATPHPSSLNVTPLCMQSHHHHDGKRFRAGVPAVAFYPQPKYGSTPPGLQFLAVEYSGVRSGPRSHWHSGRTVYMCRSDVKALWKFKLAFQVSSNTLAD